MRLFISFIFIAGMYGGLYAGNWMDVHTDTSTISIVITDVDSITFDTRWAPGETLVDSRDGQKYATVQIGTQYWMAENLNVGVYTASVNTGSDHSEASNNGTIEKYAYNNDTTNFAAYGGLYDWNEAMAYDTTEGVQGICPDGWHIPTDAEWEVLVNAVGGSSTGGTSLKEGGTSGFEALFSGYRFYDGAFSNMGSSAYFWSSLQYGANSAWVRYLTGGRPLVYHSYYNKTYGYCVRCVKD